MSSLEQTAILPSDVTCEWPCRHLDTTPMNELQRQAYLRVMGIDVVYPRLPVAAARPSPAYDLPAVPQIQSASQHHGAPAAPPDTRSAGSARARVVSELANTETTTRSDRQPANTGAAAGDMEPVAAEQSARSTDAGQDGETALRFRLHYLPVNASLSVLWEVPLHAAVDNEREARVLLSNILLALAAPLPDSPPKPETFDWPMLDAATELQAGARQAGQAVEGFMAMRRRRDGFSNLLVFAEQVATLLPGRTEPGDQRRNKLDSHLVCVSSLQAMLSVPAIKKDVWQQLQPLRQRLAASAH